MGSILTALACAGRDETPQILPRPLSNAVEFDPTDTSQGPPL